MERVTEEEQTVSLSTLFCLQLILQNSLVSLDVSGKKQTMLTITDTGSQLSYILMKTALEIKIGMSTVKSERVIHSLFGGVCPRV